MEFFERFDRISYARRDPEQPPVLGMVLGTTESFVYFKCDRPKCLCNQPFPKQGTREFHFERKDDPRLTKLLF